MRWNARRRAPDRSRDEQLAEWTAAAEAAFAASRYELARAEFEAVVAEHRERLGERPDDVEATDLLAAALNALGLCLEKLRHVDEAAAVFGEALGTSRRAVALRRAATGPADPSLARTLRTFALVRANAGAELDEAERALGDAVGVHMAVLATDPGEEHLAETYARSSRGPGSSPGGAGTSRPRGSRTSPAPATSTGCWTCSGRSGAPDPARPAGRRT